MYHIDRKNTKPDIGYMEMYVQKLAKRGIRLGDCAALRDRYVELRDTLKLNFKLKYNVDNPGSPKQVVEYIKTLASRADLSSKNDIINICYNDKEEKWTTEAKAMDKLADLGYEFARDLLDFRHAKKYAESLTSIMEAADNNGLIHPVVTLTKTNRISYSKPGLMSIPKKLLWYVITAYSEDGTLYSVDIKNQEPHILISMTGAKELEYALESPEGLYETMFKQCFIPKAVANVLVDTLPENRVYGMQELRSIGTVSPAFYSPTKPQLSSIYYQGKRVVGLETICVGSEKGVYPSLPDSVSIELEDGSIADAPVEWESADKKYKKNNDYTLEGELKGLDIRISKVERKEFKTSWLAISYGSGIQSIEENCKVIDGKRVYRYVTQIEAIKKYRSQISKLASQGINVIGTIFGNRVYAGISEYDKSNKLKRVLLDLPIQGSGADILCLLIKRFEDYTKEHGLQDKMFIYYTRHDELIIEVNKAWEAEVGNEHVVEVLNDMLEHQIDDWVPFKIEITKVGKNLDELSFSEDDD